MEKSGGLKGPQHHTHKHEKHGEKKNSMASQVWCPCGAEWFGPELEGVDRRSDGGSMQSLKWKREKLFVFEKEQLKAEGHWRSQRESLDKLERSSCWEKRRRLQRMKGCSRRDDLCNSVWPCRRSGQRSQGNMLSVSHTVAVKILLLLRKQNAPKESDLYS